MVEGLTIKRASNIQGSAIFCEGTGPIIRDCFFLNGLSSGGGAISSSSGSPQISDCRFENNVGAIGGAIFFQGGTPSVAGCIFADNSATSGGGAVTVTDFSTAVILSCTFYGNETVLGFPGSTIWVDNGAAAQVENCIIAFNGPGAGFWDDQGFSSVSCTDIYGNADGDWVGNLADDLGVNGNFSLDPLFCNPPGNDFGLRLLSPCADASGCGLVGAEGTGCVIPTDVGIGETVFGNLQFTASPNPFQESTTIHLTRSPGSGATLSVHDVTGRLVRALGPADGQNAVIWNGRNEAGKRVSAGVYFVRLQAGESVYTRRILFVQ